jgi:hypothetical protein
MFVSDAHRCPALRFGCAGADAKLGGRTRFEYLPRLSRFKSLIGDCGYRRMCESISEDQDGLACLLRAISVGIRRVTITHSIVSRVRIHASFLRLS